MIETYHHPLILIPCLFLLLLSQICTSQHDPGPEAVFSNATCGRTCLEPDRLSCANLKHCAECYLSGTGVFRGSCEANCNALPLIKLVDSLTDDPMVPETNCSMIDSQNCRFVFQYGQAWDQRRAGGLTTLSAQKAKICPGPIERKRSKSVKWKGWLVCRGKVEDSDLEQNMLDASGESFRRKFTGLKNCEFREAPTPRGLIVEEPLEVIQEEVVEEKASCGGHPLLLAPTTTLLLVFFIYYMF